VRILAFLLLLPLAAQAPPAEAQRLEQTLQSLQAMKARLQEMQTELDVLMQSLREQKGQLSAQPPAFGGGAATPAVFADSPDKPKPTVRCAALTKEGERCTRPAIPGARYCKQHGLSRQK
jgi:septal ring factor EnvC (AmiA/AmiB activator)